MADIEKDADLDLDEEEQAEEDEDKSSNQKKSDTEEDKEDESDKKDEEEIPVRKSANTSFIIQRQKQTIDKLRSKQKEKDDGEEDLTPESKTLIEREIDKHIAPIRETLMSRADEDELNELLKSEPDAKNYEKTIKAYMQSPHYKSVPPSVIYHHLAFGEAENAGANKRKIADKEAKMSRTRGNQKRPSRTSKGSMPSPEEIEDMDETEFEALQNDVRQGKYLSREE